MQTRLPDKAGDIPDKGRLGGGVEGHPGGGSSRAWVSVGKRGIYLLEFLAIARRPIRLQPCKMRRPAHVHQERRESVHS